MRNIHHELNKPFVDESAFIAQWQLHIGHVLNKFFLNSFLKLGIINPVFHRFPSSFEIFKSFQKMFCLKVILKKLEIYLSLCQLRVFHYGVMFNKLVLKIITTN